MAGEGVVLKRFGDEQSTLLDRYERLSFEAHLNKAMLGRCRSEPPKLTPTTTTFSLITATGESEAINTTTTPPSRPRRRLLRLDKVLKKLLKPILGRKPRPVVSSDSSISNKAFGRSVSVRI